MIVRAACVLAALALSGPGVAKAQGTLLLIEIRATNARPLAGSQGGRSFAG